MIYDDALIHEENVIQSLSCFYLERENLNKTSISNNSSDLLLVYITCIQFYLLMIYYRKTDKNHHKVCRNISMKCYVALSRNRNVYRFDISGVKWVLVPIMSIMTTSICSGGILVPINCSDTDHRPRVLTSSNGNRTCAAFEVRNSPEVREVFVDSYNDEETFGSAPNLMSLNSLDCLFSACYIITCVDDLNSQFL